MGGLVGSEEKSVVSPPCPLAVSLFKPKRPTAPRDPRLAKLPRRHPDLAPERVDEVRQIREADVEGNFGDRARRVTQEVDGAANARLNQKTVWGHPRFS